MAMGKRKRHAKQTSMWVATQDLSRSAAHPFYTRLNQILDKHDFDGYVEGLCQRFYAEETGRPGLPPGRYFRLLLIGYFEGLDAERAIAWRAADSFALREQLRGERLDRAASVARQKADAGKPKTRASVVSEMEAAIAVSYPLVEKSPNPRLIGWIEDQAEHYGKLVSNYRAVGIVPPASRKPASQ